MHGNMVTQHMTEYLVRSVPEKVQSYIIHWVPMQEYQFYNRATELIDQSEVVPNLQWKPSNGARDDPPAFQYLVFQDVAQRSLQKTKLYISHLK